MQKKNNWLSFLAILGIIVSTSAQAAQLQDLAAAVHNGETKTVDAILKASPQLVSEPLDEGNNTALVSAVQDGNKELVQLILTYSPTQKDQEVALAVATDKKNNPGEQGNIDEIIELLIAKPEILADAGNAEAAQILNDFWQRYPVCDQRSNSCKMGRMGKHWAKAQGSRWLNKQQWQAGREQWQKNREQWRQQHPEFQGTGSGRRKWGRRGGQGTAGTGQQAQGRRYRPHGRGRGKASGQPAAITQGNVVQPTVVQTTPRTYPSYR